MALKNRSDNRRLRSGDLTHQVIIKNMTQTSDGQGGRVGTETTLGTIWARIMPLNAQRSLSYGLLLTSRPHEVRVHYEDNAYTLDESCWLEVVETGQILYVHSVINTDMQYKQMDILTVEKR